MNKKTKYEIIKYKNLRWKKERENFDNTGHIIYSTVINGATTGLIVSYHPHEKILVIHAERDIRFKCSMLQAFDITTKFQLAVNEEE